MYMLQMAATSASERQIPPQNSMLMVTSPAVAFLVTSLVMTPGFTAQPAVAPLFGATARGMVEVFMVGLIAVTAFMERPMEMVLGLWCFRRNWNWW